MDNRDEVDERKWLRFCFIKRQSKIIEGDPGAKECPNARSLEIQFGLKYRVSLLCAAEN